MTDQPDKVAPGPGTGRAVVLIALAVLFAYFSSLHGAYVLDDARIVTDPDLGRPFRSTMAVRPVIAVTLAANYWLDGRNPRGYHLFNMAVHALAAIVLYDLVRRTLLLPRFAGRFADAAGWVGLIAALVWAVHPLNTQAVTYVIQRCESLMGLFFLLALWCVLRGATADHAARRWYAGAVACAVLGAGCKELMIVLPPLALIYDRTFLTGSWREAIRRRGWVYALLIVPPVAGVGALAITGFFSSDATVGSAVALFTPTTYALTQPGVILNYLRLALWPSPLCFDYLGWRPRTSVAEVWPELVAITALMAAATVGVLRGKPWGFLGVWVFLILAPTSTIIPIQDVSVEHRMYLPLAAIVVLVVGAAAELTLWAAARWHAARLFGAAAAGVVVLTFGVMAAARNEDYSTRHRLWADTVAKRPDNPRAQLSLGEVLYNSGLPDWALPHIQSANTLLIPMPLARVQYVNCLRETGQLETALTVARRSMNENPRNPEQTFQYGLTLLAADKPANAVPVLNAAISLPPSPTEGMFRDAVQVGVGTPAPKTARLATAAHLHLALALLDTGHPDKAATEFEAARRLDPAYVGELTSVARRLAEDPAASSMHQRMAARYATAAVHMSKPPTPEMLDTQAIALARVGRYPEAAAAAQQAAELKLRAGDPYQAGLIRARAAMFQKGRPFLPPASVE